MNNGMDNNNQNKGFFNGEILGSLNDSNNTMEEPETLEVLDVGVAPVNNENVQNVNYNTQNNINNPNMNFGTNINNVPPVQPITPEPAYTNPQNINPMPGFENPNSIGTTPPISLEPEKQPQKKKSNKTLFVIIIILALFGVGFGTYYVLKYTDLLNSKPSVVINLKNLDVNMGDSLSQNINDYATIEGTDVKNCVLSTGDVDVEKEGKYTYQITCGEIIKSGTINVIDNRELDIVTKKVYKTKGDVVEPKEFIDNPKEDYAYEFVDKTVVDGYLNGEDGTYKVKIKAISGTKTKEVESELVIMQHKVKGYLICESKEQNLADSSTTMTVKESFAILEDGNNGFGKITSEIHSFKFKDETEFTNYFVKYNTDGNITINNVTGVVNFDKENLVITITNERDYQTVVNEYGENNLVNFGSIRNHFESQLGYKCIYKN